MVQNVFSWGNKKLPKTTAIFNITTALGCPANTKNLCQLANPEKECYAMKAERRYPVVLPYRKRQFQFWKHNTAQQFVTKLIQEKCRKVLNKLRLNEAGDFKNQEDISKAEQVASILYNKFNVVTYCYTARRDLDFTIRKHLIVNGSGFMVDNKFIVTYNKNLSTGIICGGDCRVCSMCAVRANREIYVRIH